MLLYIGNLGSPYLYVSVLFRVMPDSRRLRFPNASPRPTYLSLSLIFLYTTGLFSINEVPKDLPYTSSLITSSWLFLKMILKNGFVVIKHLMAFVVIIISLSFFSTCTPLNAGIILDERA